MFTFIDKADHSEKMTPEMIKRIVGGKESLYALSKELGCSYSYLRLIKQGKIYKPQVAQALKELGLSGAEAHTHDIVHKPNEHINPTANTRPRDAAQVDLEHFTKPEGFLELVKKSNKLKNLEAYAGSLGRGYYNRFDGEHYTPDKCAVTLLHKDDNAIKVEATIRYARNVQVKPKFYGIYFMRGEFEVAKKGAAINIKQVGRLNIDGESPAREVQTRTQEKVAAKARSEEIEVIRDSLAKLQEPVEKAGEAYALKEMQKLPYDVTWQVFQDSGRRDYSAKILATAQNGAKYGESLYMPAIITGVDSEGKPIAPKHEVLGWNAAPRLYDAGIRKVTHISLDVQALHQTLTESRIPLFVSQFNRNGVAKKGEKSEAVEKALTHLQQIVHKYPSFSIKTTQVSPIKATASIDLPYSKQKFLSAKLNKAVEDLGSVTIMKKLHATSDEAFITTHLCRLGLSLHDIETTLEAAERTSAKNAETLETSGHALNEAASSFVSQVSHLKGSQFEVSKVIEKNSGKAQVREFEVLVEHLEGTTHYQSPRLVRIALSTRGKITFAIKEKHDRWRSVASIGEVLATIRKGLN